MTCSRLMMIKLPEIIIQHSNKTLLTIIKQNIHIIFITFYFFMLFQWATDLSEKLLKIHQEEIERRQNFNTLFEGHFLRSLFPGMAELPPAFATQSPPPFDANLPKLTDSDVEFVANAFPDLAKEVPIYDMNETVQFFQQRYAYNIIILYCMK